MRLSSFRRRSRHRSAKGYALAELLVAGMILAFALTAYFQAFRIGDWLNINARIHSRLGRLTRRFSDYVEYAPYDELTTSTLEEGYLYQPVDLTGNKPPPDLLPSYSKAYGTNNGSGITFLTLFPYRVVSVVEKFNVGTAREYATVSLQIYYTGQPAIADNSTPNEQIWYDNGGSLIRNRY